MSDETPGGNSNKNESRREPAPIGDPDGLGKYARALRGAGLSNVMPSEEVIRATHDRCMERLRSTFPPQKPSMWQRFRARVRRIFSK